MFLIIIYIILFLGSVVLFYINNTTILKYRKHLVYIHLISFVLLLIDILLVIGFESSFKTFWFDKLVFLCFLISGAFVFAICWKNLRLRDKFYFGFFFFYPIVAALALIMDRIFFVIVASPFLIGLTIPKTYFQDPNYDIRSTQGMMAPLGLELIKKGIFLEERIGTCRGEDIEDKAYQNLKIITKNKDSTCVSVDINGVKKNIVFSK